MCFNSCLRFALLLSFIFLNISLAKEHKSKNQFNSRTQVYTDELPRGIDDDATSRSLSSKDNNYKIIGGYKTTIKQEPYLVYVRRDGEFTCGGSVVAPKFVVSAAHCYDGYRAEQFDVTAGATYLASGGQRRSVDLIVVPPKFNPNVLNMDVAVLRLTAKLHGPLVKSIPLCTREIPQGASLRISGWGYTQRTGNVPKRVHSVDLVRLPNSRCIRAYRRRKIKLTDSMFCASVPGKDACNGDSGGPVIYKNQLCGVVSWGLGCNRKAFPGVYTNVKKVSSFIRTVIKRY